MTAEALGCIKAEYADDNTVVTGEEGAGVSMRRRANAYIFDRDMYRSWCAGGAVWLDDDDPNRPSALSAHSSHIRDVSIGAEGCEDDAEGSDSPFTYNNKNIYVCTRESFRTFGNTQHPMCDEERVSACVCDPKSAVGYFSIPPHSVPNDEPATQDAPFSRSQPFPQGQKAGNMQKSAEMIKIGYR